MNDDDPRETLRMSLFDPVVPREVRHPAFEQIRESPGHFAARRMMDEVFAAWPDPDKQFVRDFQTAGFDARTWELYLRATLVDLGLKVDTVEHRPDFRCQRDGHMFFVEATTANATGNPAPVATVDEFFDALSASTDDYDEIAIRFGSALHSKKERHYERLPHVAGSPLVIAIQGFYDAGSLTKAEVPLLRFLYGLDLVRKVDLGLAVPAPGTIDTHSAGGKVVPSGWFAQPGLGSVSAVIFSNSGTVPKFGRMGVLAGHRHPRVHMYRKGFEFDPDPNAWVPRPFVETVGEVEESWGEGLVVIHNPEAAHPLDPHLLPGVHHIFVVDDELHEIRSARRIFTQVTLIAVTVDT